MAESGVDVPDGIAEDVSRLKERVKKYDLHFENLVFEGGGCKMEGHDGAIRVG